MHPSTSRQAQRTSDTLMPRRLSALEPFLGEARNASMGDCGRERKEHEEQWEQVLMSEGLGWDGVWLQPLLLSFRVQQAAAHACHHSPRPTLLLLPPSRVEKTGLDCGVASPAVPAAMSAARLSTCGRQQQALQPPLLLLLLHGASH